MNTNRSDPFDLENHFFIKISQLKAVGDIISSSKDNLREYTLAYTGDLIVELADDLNNDFNDVYKILLHEGGVK